MPLPDVTLTIQDGGLGLVPASIANASAKIGVCSDGVVGTVYSANDNGTAASLLGQGPLVDAMAHVLSVAGGPVFALPINPSSAGSASAVTRGVQVGTGALTVSLAPRQTIAIKIGTGGTNGTATFMISLGGGAYGAIVVTVGGTFAYPVPGTLTTITLASGQTWVANDIYTVATDGTVTLSGSGPAASNVTHADSPLDAYNVQLTVVTTGALGAGVFSYSIDGGNSVSGQILIPSGGKYAIPGTGVVLVFSGTFTAGDTYSFTTTTAGFSNSDVTTALTALLAAPIDFAFVHLVGMGANSAAAAATAAVVQTAMGTAEAGFRYMFAVTECPTSESDATVAAAFGTTVAIRVGVCAGDAALISPLNGRILRRNLAWVYTARLALIPAGEDPGFVGRGSIPNIGKINNVSLFRDEQATPLLDAARFVTMRSFPGRPGYFITNGNMMASPGSDFGLVQRRRVMDIACRITRAVELNYLNGSVRTNADGTIDERDAQTFESDVNAALTAGVVAPGYASSSSVVVSRSQNITSTNTEPVTVRIRPLAYLKQIQTNIGFATPTAPAS